MKALCITGMSSASLEQVGSLFFDAGVSEAKPVERSSTVTIDSWEKTILDKQPQSSPTVKISNLWRQLAADLLLGNMDSSIWAWTSSTSALLLDFWAELDHDIHFLLVGCSLQEGLANEVNNGANLEELQKYYHQWCQYHQTLLQFYLTHPKRCLLVDRNVALNNGAKLLQTVSERWGWNLSVDKKLTTNFQVNSCSKISYYLAQQLIAERFGLPDFVQEISTAQHPLVLPHDGGFTNEPAITFEELLTVYQQERQEQQREAIENSRHQQQAVISKQQYHSKLAELNSHIAELVSSNQQLRQSEEQSRVRLTHVENEAEKLLLELHNTQQELEQALQNQQVSQHQLTQKEEHARACLTHVESEAEKLLMELHNTQQELEQALMNNESIQQQSNQAQQQALLAQQQSQQLMEQQQALNAKMTALENRRDQLAQSEEQLRARLSQVENEAEKLLLELHNTQQKLEQALIRQYELQKQQQTAESAKSLGALPRLWSGKKAALPKLNFSELQLRHVQVNPDYEHLWFSLKNPEFGKHQLPQWQFRLSCAAIRPGQFGSQPKLEFPKQPQQLLGNWFAESQDDFGEKLELRFALPDAMDKGLWKKLGTKDQQLLQALINQLPAMLQQAQQLRPTLSRSWQDWHSLAEDVQRIYALKARPGK